MITPLQRTMVRDTVFMRSMNGRKLSPSPSLTPNTLTAETPPSISNLLHDDADTPAKLQLLSGAISQEIINTWTGKIPTSLRQKLYRALHMTITTHQHSAWIERNSILHPSTVTSPPTDYGRAPARKRLQLEEEEDNTKDNTWKKQRNIALIRRDMWDGIPIPHPQSDPKAAHKDPTDSPSSSNSTRSPPPTRNRARSETTSSESSDTDEWPSPSRMDRMHANQSNTPKRKRRHPITVRRAARPTKRALQTTAHPTPTEDSDTPPQQSSQLNTLEPNTPTDDAASTHTRRGIDDLITYIHDPASYSHTQKPHTKRKRLPMTSIRKAARPTKQARRVDDQPTSTDDSRDTTTRRNPPPNKIRGRESIKDRNPPYKRRSVEDLIEYIHDPNSYTYRRRTHLRQVEKRKREGEEGPVSWGRRRRRCLGGQDSTAPADSTQHNNYNLHNDTHTMHAALEQQPPPLSQEGEVRGWLPAAPALADSTQHTRDNPTTQHNRDNP